MMLEFLVFMLNIAWKALGVICGWLLLKYILRNGTGTIKEILDTISLGVKAMCCAIRKKLADHLRKEVEKDKVKVEATVE